MPSLALPARVVTPMETKHGNPSTHCRQCCARSRHPHLVRESSDIHGLNLEGDTFDDLVAKVPGAVADLIEANGGYGDDVSIEIVGRVHTQTLRLAAE